MAKRAVVKRVKAHPPRKPPEPSGDDSLLVRSAEALGRAIGVLQRQLDRARLLSHTSSAAKRTNSGAGSSRHTKPRGARKTETRKTTAPGSSRRSKRAAASAKRR